MARGTCARANPDQPGARPRTHTASRQRKCSILNRHLSAYNRGPRRVRAPAASELVLRSRIDAAGQQPEMAQCRRRKKAARRRPQVEDRGLEPLTS